MNIRQRSEAWEHEHLPAHAAFADQTAGRARAEQEDDIRTAYQRDRDRILHCNAFRRLMHKTQVFISPQGDHYRTRLTHTLEVAQIARTIARALLLNEDLTEAIAYGHDIGHTPFGHAGEAGLNAVCPGGFRHYEQSVRVAARLEKNGMGLNLTAETLDGMRNHGSNAVAATQEGRVVRFADKIAYMNHDIEDAVRAQLICEEELPFAVKCALGRGKSERITTLVQSIAIHSTEDVCMGEAELAAYQELREFLFRQVYRCPAVREEEGKAAEVVKRLYEYFITKQDKLPTEYLALAAVEGTQRAVTDYISGMSDRFAIAQYESLFIPRAWGNDSNPT